MNAAPSSDDGPGTSVQGFRTTTEVREDLQTLVRAVSAILDEQVTVHQVLWALCNLVPDAMLAGAVGLTSPDELKDHPLAYPRKVALVRPPAPADEGREPRAAS